ncbi:NUDIX hydrolase [Spirosoma luteolum]
MHRQSLLHQLDRHLADPTVTDPAEQAMTRQTLAFVTAQPACFERTLLIGHVTGSAFIVSPDRQQTVLIHHRKLNRWFQPGGHADGDPDIAGVALREAQEETGLTRLTVVGMKAGEAPIFDVDVHPIPARGSEPAHLHYDIRYLIEADPAEPFGETDEIQGIRWFSLKEAEFIADSPSITRMLHKINKN